MKRILFNMLAISVMAFSHAQEGEIIYTDFEPDLCVAWISPPYPHDTIRIDFDQDGTTDFMVLLSWRSTGEIAIDMVSFWEHRYKISDNDSIVPSEYVWPTHHGWLYPNWTWQHMFESGATHSEDYIGFRNTINEEHYHAWVWVYADIEYTSSHNKVWVYVDRMAYCTIPNYMLRWGQTSLTTGFEENETSAFATICPNPTNSTFTVTGKNLKSAEVRNALGQRVATAKGKGETLQIDIAKLPAGIYFVNITDEEGHKCVRKVVKE